MSVKFYNMDIEKYRLRTNKSVSQLAELLEVAPAAIYNYKYGKSKPSYESIEKMLLDGAKIDEVFDENVRRKVFENSDIEGCSDTEFSEKVRQVLLDMLEKK